MTWRKLLFTILALGVLAGCETASVNPSGSEQGQVGDVGVVPEVPAGRASIVFVRGNELAGSANYYRVFVNGKAVADMSTGTKHTQVVAPGPVNLNAETVANVLNIGLGLALMEKPQMQIQAVAGSLYVVELDPGIAGGPVFQLRDVQALHQSRNFRNARVPTG